MIVILEDILEWIDPFHPNSVLGIFLEVVFFDGLSLAIFGSLFAPFQVDWPNFSNLIVLLDYVLVQYS